MHINGKLRYNENVSTIVINRKIILQIFSIIFGVLGFFVFRLIAGMSSVTQWFGMISFLMIYAVLLGGSIYSLLPDLAYRSGFIEVRKSVLISSSFFSLMHAFFGFFTVIGGSQYVQQGGGFYAFAVLLGVCALVLVFAATVMLLPYFARRFEEYEGLVWRGLYVAGLLILVHSLVITVHLFPLKIVLAGLYLLTVVLMGLESLRFDRYLSRRLRLLPANVFVVGCFPVTAIIIFWSFFMN